MQKLIRQGDVLFVPMSEKIPEYAKQDPSGIIAQGEATGHHHRIAVLEDAALYRVSQGAYLRVGENGVSITHEEHGPVTVPEGDYQITIMREYDPLAQYARQVRD